MNQLFQHCQEWEFGNCPFAVTAESLKKRAHSLQAQEYYRSLNTLCRNCHTPLWIVERQCPVCGEKELINVYSCSNKSFLPRAYRLICPQCGRWLFTGSYHCMGVHVTA